MQCYPRIPVQHAKIQATPQKPFAIRCNRDQPTVRISCHGLNVKVPSSVGHLLWWKTSSTCFRCHARSWLVAYVENRVSNPSGDCGKLHISVRASVVPSFPTISFTFYNRPVNPLHSTRRLPSVDHSAALHFTGNTMSNFLEVFSHATLVRGSSSSGHAG